MCADQAISGEERSAINAEIERLWNTSPAVAEGIEHTKAEWKAFSRKRKRLFKKLGGDYPYYGCRYCGGGSQFFMLQGELWRKVVGVEPGRRSYSAGYVCLACVTQRIYPRQLYDSDLGEEGRGCSNPDVEGYLCDSVEWTNPETGDDYEAGFALLFPSEGGEPAVKIVLMTELCGPPGEWSEAIWDELYRRMCDEISWLKDYCRAHELKLFIDNEELELGSAPVSAV